MSTISTRIKKQDKDGNNLNAYLYNHDSFACYECIVASKVGGLVYDSSDKDIDSNGVNLGRKYVTDNDDNLITFVTKTNTGIDYSSYYNNPEIVKKLRNAYYNALYKERFDLVKVSSYVNAAN